MLVTETGSRRRSDRVPLDVLVELRTSERDEAPLEADGLNVSEGGMAMRSPRAPAAGTRLECRFHCPPESELVCAQAEVVWSSTRGPTLGSFGLRFIELDTKSATCLRRLVSPAGAREPARDERRVATLSIDGIGPPVEAELKLADETRMVLEQRLSFLQLGRGVEVSVLGRGRERGRIASVELRQSHHDVPTVVYRVLLEGAVERAADAAPVDGAQPFAHVDEPIELVRTQVARAPRPRRSERSPAYEVSSEPFHEHASSPSSGARPIDEPTERTSQVPPGSTSGSRNRRVSTAGRTSAVPPARSSQPPAEDAAATPRSTMLGLDAAWVRATAAEADAAEAAALAVQAHDTDDERVHATPTQRASARVTAPEEDVPEEDATEAGAQEAPDDETRDESDTDEGDDDYEKRQKPAGLLAQVGQVPLYVGRLVQVLLGRLRPLTNREGDAAPGSDDVKTWLLLQIARIRGAVIALYQRVAGGSRNPRATRRPARLRVQRATLPGLGPAEGGRDDVPRRVRLIAAALVVVGIGLGIYAVAPVSGAPSNDMPESTDGPIPDPEPTMSEELTMEVEPPVDAPSQTERPRARDKGRADKGKTVAQASLDETPEKYEAEDADLEVMAADEGEPLIENTATRFGFATVPNGRTFSLRMNGPVTRLDGSARENGFTVRVYGGLATEGAKPISSAHRAVARSLILNKKGYAELTIDFVPGLAPRYQVLAKYDTLEITLERIDAAAQSASAVKNVLP
jgi:hypothetical protein